MAERRDEDRLPGAVLEVWGSAPPSPGFSERVLKAALPKRPATSRWPWAIGLVVPLGAAAALWPVMTSMWPSSGAVDARERSTIAIGRRGRAVLEAGAAIRWDKGVRAVQVHQSRGDVFYRVDPGGPFVVETPGGRVAVAGTCFRVEVDAMNGKMKAWGGVAAGMLLGATVTVTVYEGRVAFASRDGTTLGLQAGERGTAAPGEAPQRLEAERATGVPLPRLTARALGMTSGDERETRIAALREEIARLKEAALAAQATPPRKDTWTPEGKDELEALAKRCEVRYDLPPSAFKLDQQVDEEEAETLGLAPGERLRINEAMRTEGIRLIEALRDLYVQITGNRGAATVLEPFTLQQEILSKSNQQEVALARQRLAQERAGHLQPRPDGPPVERALRLLSKAGDEWERKLTDVIGPDRARALRSPNRLFARWRTNGCPNGGPSSEGSD